VSSPSVIVPVHYGPHGFSQFVLEVLNVKPKKESTRFCLGELERTRLSDLEAELLYVIDTHNPTSPQTLSGKIHLICRREGMQIPDLVMKKLHERFPYTPWEDIFRMLVGES